MAKLHEKFKKKEFLYFLIYRFVGGIPFFVSNISADELEPGKWKFFVADDYCYIGSTPTNTEIEEGKYSKENNVFKNQNEITQHINSIEKVKSELNDDIRTLELKNWLNYLKN